MEKQINSFAYDVPPITEAIIEIRFNRALEKKELPKLLKKLASHYDHQSELEHMDVSVDLGADTVRKTNTGKRYRFASSDQTEVCILSDDRFLVSQLAPYCGWAEFKERFARDFTIWNDCTSYRQIVQIGVRYLNRIDLPVVNGEVAHEEYLNVYPSLPPMIELVDHFATQAVVSFHDLGASLRLNCGLVKSPIADHLSILFDQDIVKDKELPNTDLDEVLTILEKIRIRKNEVFEASITDKSRELFNDKK